MDIVFLCGLRIETVIGIYEWEKKIRQPVILDLEMSTDVARAAASGRIEYALDYKAISEHLKQFVGESQVELVETLAERCAEIIRDEFGCTGFGSDSTKSALFPTPRTLVSSSSAGSVVDSAKRQSIVMSRNQPLDPKREFPAIVPHFRGEAATPSDARPPGGGQLPRVRCWISIGSNQDRERCIRGAMHTLRERFGGLILSSVYESEAVGFDGQPFLNLVAGFDFGEPVSVLLTALQSVEDSFGRVRGPNKFAPRTLDLDLLTYGDLAGTIDGCTLPRDEILYHAFVLGPLAEVAAQERHSTGGCCYGELWRAFEKSAPPLRPVAFEF